MTGPPGVTVRIKCDSVYENTNVLDICWIHRKIGKDTEDGINYCQGIAKQTPIFFNLLSFNSELKNLYSYILQ